ncbi:MAG: MFS transporter [Proteobacteria bacterium]|nr:MFS transporter [Pseudomonadota bacterium]
MSIFSALNREQKEAVGLLQIGTFLEYFDLMLYVHMAVLLNDLFFPKADPKTAGLLTALAFCSTYVLRPFGALLFGYIGDHIGRKTTVIMTTMMMATSCIIMATLPTYAQIGIVAAWLVTICRIIQGLSSMGEIIGAEIYVTEITKPPVRYPAVGLIGCASRFGTMVALGIAYLVTSFGFDWRNGFWIGAAIAVVGSVARTRLRETPDFVDMKRNVKQALEQAKEQGIGKTEELLKIEKKFQKDTLGWKILLAIFLVYSGAPVCLYFSYMHCGSILKTSLGLSPEAIIHQNFIVSVVEFLFMVLTVYLSYTIHPLKILKFKGALFLPFLVLFPFVTNDLNSSFIMLLMQCISVSLTLTPIPATAVFMQHMPVFRRFTYASLIYALSRALMAVLTSFGLVFLTDILGQWGIYFIMIPVTIGFLWGVSHFEELEHISKKSAFSKIFKFS